MEDIENSCTENKKVVAKYFFENIATKSVAIFSKNKKCYKKCNKIKVLQKMLQEKE